MVFDFDNHDKGAEEKDFVNVDDTWIEEVEAMREICVLNGIDPLVERSRSGKGAHIWIFFDKPIAASLVRKFGLRGCCLLEKKHLFKGCCRRRKLYIYIIRLII